jgi:hypothetical protein
VDELKSVIDMYPKIPQHTLKKYEVHQHLKYEAYKNCPSPMMVQWKNFILKV